jgi:hypothetical protein
MTLNYGQLKKLTLQLAFSESIAGEEIPYTYNNQADYIRAIPGLANDGMMYIATTVKKIPELVPLTSLESEDFGAYTLYTLPKDFWQLNNGGLIWQRPDIYDIPRYSYQRYHGYKLYARNKLMIPKNVKNLDGMMVEYYRYPETLGDDPDDLTELDNTPETHSALPYYIAAQLVMYDDPFRYASLSNEFETRLSRITEPVTVEYAPVEDAYFGFNMPGV